MFISKKQKLKKFSYILLSLTSLTFCEESHAKLSCPVDEGRSRLISRSVASSTEERGDYQQDRQYNIVGIALFSGRDFISYGIKKLTDSKTSHVALILANAADEQERFFFESTGTAQEALHGQYPHVRLTGWEEVTEKYSGRIAYRLFVFEGERIPSQKVTGFVENYIDKPYTKNPFKLVKAWLRANHQSKSHAPRTVFCSELVAKALMEWGLLGKQTAASNWLPKDFTSKRQITLTPGVALTEEFIEK